MAEEPTEEDQELSEEIQAAILRGGGALVFGLTDDQPFDPSMVNRRAQTAWRKAKLRRITMHECRHTFASIGIAAGLNAKP
jgi:integrase